MILANGCWADYRIVPEQAAHRPCLFLDRDGVLIEDTGYPHDAASIVLIPEVLDLVCAANRTGFVTGIVSNQSGIGRGYFGWDAFAGVQRAIDAALAERGGHLDFVMACPHVREAGTPEYRIPNHPWRKPAPGMMRAAAARLGLNLDRSALVGDRDTDMAAAAAASIGYRAMLGTHAAIGTDKAWADVTRRDLSKWLASIPT